MSEFPGVVPPLAAALVAKGYTELTPVQLAMLDDDLLTKDALVSAQTGSGKTVAFGLSMAPTLLGGADRFERAVEPVALVIAPTRELAMQVKRELEWLYAKCGCSIASCVGGMDMRTERRSLERGAHIVVGTPGRLRDHITRGVLDLSRLKVAVLDEADEMLDLGFSEDLEFILGEAPETRRTLMFSATVPNSISRLASKYQNDAVRIAMTGEQKQHSDIEYRALTIAPSDQENAIINVLRFYQAKNALVFCATRATVNHMTARLNNRGLSVVALSGELSQNERTHALQAMRDGRAQVCVATDVAARGIDLPGLELVIHADVPKSQESLLHRSGRTGRAGSKGVSALIVPIRARRRTESLLRAAKITAEWATPPSADDIIARDDERILQSTALLDPIEEKEAAFVAKLLEAHSPETIAAAFVRQLRAGQSAPEELQDVSTEKGKPSPRDDFKDGVWFVLSVGRKQAAEPRWLLPVLIREGGITKREIGAINVQQTETFVEINPTSVNKFLKTLGPKMILEDAIKIARVAEGVTIPKSSPPPRRDFRDKRDGPRGTKPPYKGKGKPEYADKKPPFKGKGKPRTEGDARPAPEKKPPAADGVSHKAKKSKKPHRGQSAAAGKKKARGDSGGNKFKR